MPIVWVYKHLVFESIFGTLHVLPPLHRTMDISCYHQRNMLVFECIADDTILDHSTSWYNQLDVHRRIHPYTFDRSMMDTAYQIFRDVHDTLSWMVRCIRINSDFFRRIQCDMHVHIQHYSTSQLHMIHHKYNISKIQIRQSFVFHFATHRQWRGLLILPIGSNEKIN